MPSERVVQLKQRLDRLVLEEDVDLEPPTPEERVVYEAAARNFTSQGPELLDAATEYLWAYYHSVAAALSPGERERLGVPTVDESADIWEQVEIRSPPAFTLGGRRFAPARSYISFEGEVSWEIEHGLQLVFEDGRRLCKVGPYDGHETNANAYGDESLLDVVFKS